MGYSVEKEMATHSSILAWRIPWTEEPGGLQSTGLQIVGHDWATKRKGYSETRNLVCDAHEKWKLISSVLSDPMDYQSMEFSRPEYWSRWPSLLQGIFPSQELNLGLNWTSLQVDSLPLSHKGSPVMLMFLVKFNMKTKVTFQWKEMGMNLKIKRSHSMKCFKLILVILNLPLLACCPTLYNEVLVKTLILASRGKKSIS